MTTRPRLGLPALRRAETSSEPAFDPASWSGALIVIAGFLAIIWGMQIANSSDHYGLNRFGLKPRSVAGLWGVLMQPLLHASWGHLLSNTLPLALIGWALLLSGLRVFVFVTVTVVVIGGLLTWLVAPSNEVIVGASGLVFGWLGYLIARAVFSRRLKWIVTAVALLVIFGTLLGSLLPTVASDVSWQSHVCGFVVGAGVGWLLHPRKTARSAAPKRRASAGTVR